MKDNIKLSPKHGVNPSVLRCFYCGKDYAVALMGKLPNDEQAPRETCHPAYPCDECAGFMKQGIILISIRNGQKESLNPIRSGRFAVVKEEAFTKVFKGDVVAIALKCRFAFVDDSTWDKAGLPKGDEDERRE